MLKHTRTRSKINFSAFLNLTRKGNVCSQSSHNTNTFFFAFPCKFKYSAKCKLVSRPAIDKDMWLNSVRKTRKGLNFMHESSNFNCSLRKWHFFAGFPAMQGEKLNRRACVLVEKIIVALSFLFLRHKQTALVCSNLALGVPSLVLTKPFEKRIFVNVKYKYQ